MPSSIASVISHKMASYAELDTVLGTEDLYVLLEIIAVDAYNQQVARKNAEKK